MTKCSLCGQEDLCFTCPYCKGVYCGNHRLPEGHGCPAMHQVREDAKRKVSESVGAGEYEDNQTWSSVIPKKNVKKVRRKSGRKRFSSTELRNLLIACILVTLVGISMLGAPYGIVNALQAFVFYISSPIWWVPVGMIVIFLLSFIGHEMAHKFTAQHYGMWSEFRMTSMGYYLSAIAILFSIPIFGTGTVYTSGTSNREHDAKTNLAGPLSNFFIATGLVMIQMLAYVTLSGYTLSNVLFLVSYGILINGILGLFNMIPFQPFDGGTVREWNLYVWITLTIALIAILVMGYFVVPMLLAV
ncbi:MAG: AN1-type zinc finger domain-containing protein [Candidatus Thorarchaeota archaeon]